MSSEFNGEFAKLTPRNYVAQRLFSKTHAYVVEQKHAFHLSFMKQDEKAPHTVLSEEPVESSTDYDTDPDTDEEGYEAQKAQTLGHFVLSLDKGKAPEMPHLGWRAGRGAAKFYNRNVDLLLAKPKDGMGKSLASVHMILQFHAKSGFLTLRSGSEKVLVEYYADGKWTEVNYSEKQLMYERCTMVRAGECEYELEYTVETEQRTAYFSQRNRFIQEVLGHDIAIYPPLKAVPGDSCVQRAGRYIEFETRGHGTFGWISQGVDTKTGDLIAIKELRISNERVRKEATEEVTIGRRVPNERGLLPILDTSCEHGHLDSCSDHEKYHIFLPYALSDFTMSFWSSPDLHQSIKLQLLKEPLEGLKSLHSMGIMHRDIRPANMLIISIEPPRAAICDYGKAIEAGHSVVTTIGPIHTLAPEVWTVGTDGPYTQKIDTWAYGYAIAEILGYSVRKYPGSKGFQGDNNPRITRNRHAAILAMLRVYGERTPQDRPVVDLASRLLAWTPQARLSAAQALEHECWASISQEDTIRRVDDADDDESEPSTKRVLRQA